LGEAMRKQYAALRIGLLTVALLSARTLVCGQDFNEALLRSGHAAYQDKRYLEAIDQFRVAVFGSLDKPIVLCEGLARLYLAQEAAGKRADADQTLDRFLEIERRFGVYPQVNLEPEIRSEFRARLASRVPAETLLALPTLAGFVETEEQKIAKLPAGERRKALEAAAKREPSAGRWPIALAREALERGDSKGAARWAEKALALDGANPEALALHARARVAQGECADALKDLAALPPAELEKRPDLFAGKFVCLVEGGDWIAAEQVAPLVPAGLSGRSDVARAQQKFLAERQRQSAAASAPGAKTASKPQTAVAPAATIPKSPAEPLPAEIAARSRETLANTRRLVSDGKASEAEKALTEALKTDPGNRDLRLALLEATCLARAYQKGAAQVSLLAPFKEAEAAPMFYAAVVLYETGHGSEARGYFERALPRVSGPLVDEYSKKILERR
jgi:tetratricopeptide (TPR) repeat protein